MLPSTLPTDVQADLLATCVQQDESVGERLRALGATYDDLRYVRNAPLTFPPRTYVALDDRSVPPPIIPAVSFFSGAGGMDTGFQYAGYDNVASVEFNRIFCDTLRLNHPGKAVIGPPDFSGDVRQFQEIADALRSRAGLPSSKLPFEGVFHGGPPCQSFSMAANQRFARGDDNFKRTGFAHSEYGSLLEDYIRLIIEFRPRVFVIENVPGLKLMDGGKQLRRALEPVAAAGYEIAEPTVVNAADYGVPQMRQRLFVVGARDVAHAFRFPPKDRWHVPSYEALDRPLLGVANHETREHKAASLLRYTQLAYGERDQLGRVDRLHPLKPSKTVIAGGLKGGGRSHLHPFIPRTMSARESARLQTFPDHYVFTGPSARQFTQIGNAVPPLLAHRLATAIREQVFEGIAQSRMYRVPAVQATLALETAGIV